MLFGGHFDPDKFHAAPDWAGRLVYYYTKRLTPRVSLFWKHHPKGRCFYGCASWVRMRIIIHGNTLEKTDEALMVVLHEIAHILAPPAKSESAHGPRFWAKAIELYRDHGILEYALKHERYASGRKAVAKALGVELPKKPRRKRVNSRPLILQASILRNAKFYRSTAP